MIETHNQRGVVCNSALALAERLKEHLDEAEILRRGLAHEGPKVIRQLQMPVAMARLHSNAIGRYCMSLREIGRRSELSPTYLSMVLNGQKIISFRAYLKLVGELNNRRVATSNMEH
jgi:hypothetical protein